MTSPRWPRSVYGTGSEPDPRFSLANERTFLAWIRTSLALLAVAAAVDALPLQIDDRAQAALAAVLALTGLASAYHSWRGWARVERAMREDAPLPGNAAGIVVVVGVSLAGIVLVVASVTRIGS
ncbi:MULTISPECIES: YidH family protein [unclassified Ornithinimicrobium]|uniref:YidH family protein n=1 Tax=unclassified Ornithinimicrobium TaxID=2615080 RepID=UPI0038538136